MEKEFVSYDQAVALKELGFDEPCIGWFMKINPLGKEFLPSIRFDKVLNQNQVSAFGDENCLAPTKQQAIMFLLNKCDDMHGAELSIEYFGDESGILKNYGGKFNSLSEAIDKLIMLANDKMP
jgi:hypothetical protein